jgi:hypothetical protein
MATRSFIGIEREDHSVEAIYCHFDGYVEGGVGEVLLNHYTDPTKAYALIQLGSISTIGDTLEEVVAYHRDRGEPMNDCNKPFVNKSVHEYFSNEDVSYIYMFTQEGEWIVKRVSRSLLNTDSSCPEMIPCTINDYLKDGIIY